MAKRFITAKMLSAGLKKNGNKVPPGFMYPPSSNLDSEYIFTREYKKAAEFLERGLDMIEDDLGERG